MSARILSLRATRSVAVLQALLVTFLWSTSWVLIKLGLAEIPPLTFAGLRYTLAFFCLLPIALRPSTRFELARLTRRDWLSLLVLGLLFYSVTQGAQFVGLRYLPAVTVGLLLNFTTISVAAIGIFLLAEHPTRLQWIGASLALAGALIYFSPSTVLPEEVFGLAVVGVGVLANALSSVLGRHVNRSGQLSSVVVTTTSMGVGGVGLLFVGMLTQGLPSLTIASWGLIIWLALINTAFAFTLWNYTLRTLRAVESSTINNTMLVQIAILAWVFLEESLTLQEIIGLLVVAVGVLAVQLGRK